MTIPANRIARPLLLIGGLLPALAGAACLSPPGPDTPATRDDAVARQLSDVEATRDGAQVTLTWTAGRPVDVLLSDDPAADPDRMTVVSENDADGRHVVRDLGDITRPYFYLRTGDGRGRRVAVRVAAAGGRPQFPRPRAGTRRPAAAP